MIYSINRKGGSHIATILKSKKVGFKMQNESLMFYCVAHHRSTKSIKDACINKWATVVTHSNSVPSLMNN